jgi:hypothetical protein
MSLVIPDEILHAIHMTDAELLEEIAVLLYQQGEADPRVGQPTGSDESTAVSIPAGQPTDCDSL